MSQLLNDFISEAVEITTMTMITVQTESGEMAEIPLTIEGTFIDFDDDFIMIQLQEGGPMKLVAREQVVTVALVDQMVVAMADPEKPKRGDMN